MSAAKRKSDELDQGAGELPNEPDEKRVAALGKAKEKLLRDSDEKVAIAVRVYDMFDKHIVHLGECAAQTDCARATDRAVPAADNELDRFEASLRYGGVLEVGGTRRRTKVTCLGAFSRAVPSPACSWQPGGGQRQGHGH